jgi:hypothetical protein
VPVHDFGGKFTMNPPTHGLNGADVLSLSIPYCSFGSVCNHAACPEGYQRIAFGEPEP